jgi:hypothetical protein
MRIAASWLQKAGVLEISKATETSPLWLNAGIGK